MHRSDRGNHWEKPEIKFAPDRYADLRYFICDVTRAKRELGWEPKIMPKDGVSTLIDWIKENRNVLVTKEDGCL